MLNTYDTLDDVRQLFAEAVRKHGDTALENIMLLEEDLEGDTMRRLGVGSELLAYVRDVA